MTARALLAAATVLFTTSVYAHAVHPREGEKRQVDTSPTGTVLCYHIVESPQDRRMEVSRETFRQQMRYLAATGYTVIPLHDLYEFVSGKRASIPKNSVVVTIDDGWRSTYTEVFPEMQKRHFPFTVFIYPRIIGQTANALSWKQVKEMADAGVDVQSHSLSHPFLTHRRHASFDDKAYAEWLEHELNESKKILERQTGHAVSFIAYPYGDYDRHVASMAAKVGYTAALTCDFGPVRKGSDPLRMRRVVIDKSMDFAAFRHYLGNGALKLESTTPLPGSMIDPGQPVVSAKIRNFQTLDPKSVGMVLLSTDSTPFLYDPRDGSISTSIRDNIAVLKGKYLRALVWGNDTKSGKRVEGTWTFRLPEALSTPLINPMTVPMTTPPALTDPNVYPAPPKPSDEPLPGAVPTVQPAPVPMPASGGAVVHPATEQQEKTKLGTPRGRK